MSKIAQKSPNQLELLTRLENIEIEETDKVYNLLNMLLWLMKEGHSEFKTGATLTRDFKFKTLTVSVRYS
jgi:hypothetical protein